MTTLLHKLASRSNRPGADSQDSRPSRSGWRVRVAAIGLFVAVSALFLGAGSASAAAGVQSAGSVGAVYEQALPGKCFNMSNGYFVYAYGPTVYGSSASTQIVRFKADLWDSTAGRYIGTGNWSTSYYVNNRSGVNYANTSYSWKVNRGDALLVNITIDWLNSAGTSVIGQEQYLVNTYGYVYGSYASIQSHC